MVEGMLSRAARGALLQRVNQGLAVRQTLPGTEIIDTVERAALLEEQLIRDRENKGSRYPPMSISEITNNRDRVKSEFWTEEAFARRVKFLKSVRLAADEPKFQIFYRNPVSLILRPVDYFFWKVVKPRKRFEGWQDYEDYRTWIYCTKLFIVLLFSWNVGFYLWTTHRNRMTWDKSTVCFAFERRPKWYPGDPKPEPVKYQDRGFSERKVFLDLTKRNNRV